MWWQMKPTRLVGVLAVALALVAGGTLTELLFGEVQFMLSP
jgi:hypothetical protein